MMSHLLSLQRASWKWRVVALIVMVVTIHQLTHDWSHRHDDLAIARWLARSMIFCGLWMVCVSFVVGVLGRMPKWLARGPGGLNRTLPQIYADIAKEKREEQNASRKV